MKKVSWKSKSPPYSSGLLNRDLGDKLGFKNSRAFMDKFLDAGTEVPA